MALTPNDSRPTTIVASDDCLSTTTDGESVILYVERGEYYGFNKVGTDIREFTQEPRSADEACEHIRREHDVDEGRYLAGVAAAVAETLDLVTIINE